MDDTDFIGLLKWYQKHCNGDWEHRYGLKIDTLDNPGWMLIIDLCGTQLGDHSFEEIDFEQPDGKWIQCSIANGQFQGFGGPLNLEGLIKIFLSWNNKYSVPKNSLDMDDDDLIWIQDWYKSQCDGDWEHQFGIKVETLDNPGWSIQISIQETELQNKEFQNISIERIENDWFHCFVRDGKFEGPCGPYNLSEVLKIFREWVEGCS